MCKKIREFIKAFYTTNRSAALFCTILLALLISQWAYLSIRDNPAFVHYRIGAEQGLSVDSVMQLKKELELRGFIEKEILKDYSIEYTSNE